MSADVLPLQIGAVYYEDASGVDEAGDRFEITFSGGAPNTQLAELAIQTDKTGDGLTIGDVFFDTDPGGLGAFGAVPLQIIEQAGIDSASASVVDGGTSLGWSFTGFDPGDRLIFHIDVDEQGFLGPNAVAEGNELEGSQLAATLTAPHHFDAVTGEIFVDHYQQKLDDSGLDLPPDDYVPPGETPTPIRTAAAVCSLTQTPLPITIGGTVFEDIDLDNTRDAGEPGLPGVELRLMERQGTEYTDIDRTTVTDADGAYRFEGVLPGTYQIVQTQPEGFYSIGARAGSVGGAPRGVVAGPDVISDVTLLGGEDAIENDFGEARPAGLGGNVYHDADNDGLRDPGEAGIGGVSVHVQYLPPTGPVPAAIETTTAPDGSWSVDGLMPGDYSVTEIQPEGYFDGLDAAGTAGGTAENPGDAIAGIWLHSGGLGQQYNFGELVPSSISGRVIADSNGNCLYDPGEALLPGVTVLLRDAGDGLRATTQTDAQGQYTFTQLPPGVYAVEEIQPDGYYDGGDRIGSAGGALVPPDSIVEVELVSGTAAVGYDFCELEPAGISGSVYVDFNQNAVRDAGEAGIAGVKLTLLDGQGQPTSTTAVTEAAGFYRFEGLIPQQGYGVAEAQPEGFLDGLDAAGTAGGTAHNPGDSITGIFLAPGMHAQDYDFGELRPASPAPPVEPELNDQPPTNPGGPPPASPPIYLMGLWPPSLPVAPLPSRPSPAVGFRPAEVVSPAVGYSPSSGGQSLRRLYGGGGGQGGGPYEWFSWHLSVVNGGQPRRRPFDRTSFRPTDGKDAEGYDQAADLESVVFHPASWTGTNVQQSQWIVADADGRAEHQVRFGLPGGTPIAGDWNGDGLTEVGVFLDGLWFLDLNGNGVWDEDDLWVQLGASADTPVVGDWDGDGKSDIGVFGAAWPGDDRAIAAEPGLPDVANAPTGRYKNVPPQPEEATVGRRTMKRTCEGKFRSDVIDHVFKYGAKGDVAVTGDWNGDGVTNIGIFRKGTWYLDADGNGRWSSGDVHVPHFGIAGDVPVVGDFNSDGIDELGVYRRGTWYVDADGDRTLTARDRVFELGGLNDKPAVGDFNGDGFDEIAVYRDGGTAPDAQAGRALPDAPNVATSPSRPTSR